MKKRFITLLLLTSLILSGCETEAPKEQEEPEVNYEDLSDLGKAVYDSVNATGYQMLVALDLGEPIGIVEANVDVEGIDRFVHDANIYLTEIEGVLYEIHFYPNGYKAIKTIEFIAPPIHEYTVEMLTQAVTGDEVLTEDGYYEIDIPIQDAVNGKLWIENGRVSKIEYVPHQSSLPYANFLITVYFSNYNHTSVTLPEYVTLNEQRSAQLQFDNLDYTYTETTNGFIYEHFSTEIIYYQDDNIYQITNGATFLYDPSTQEISYNTITFHVDEYLSINNSLQDVFPYYLFPLLDALASE